jgi:beta-lactamase regulating signal transducer with metallopeptidase domain
MHHVVIAGYFSWLLAHGFAAPSAFHAFAQIAAPVTVAAFWQGTLVAAGLAVCLRFAPRISAAHRFGTWVSAFAVLVALQVLPFLGHFARRAAAGAASSSSPYPRLQLDAHWSLLFAALWIALAALRAGDLVLHSVRLRRLWKSATPVEDSRAAALAAGLGLKRVQVCTTPELDRPSVIGFFAPRILIPDWLHARLTPGELEQVILHEAEHLRRRDDWTNLLQKLCLVLFPLNPALAWIERRLCREREMACDEGVVRVTRAPRSYAACLASLAERRLQRRAETLSLGALSLGVFARRPELAHRVHSLLFKKNVLGPIGTRALLGMVGCGLLFGSVELARCPQLVAFVPAHSLAAAREMAQQADEASPVRMHTAMPKYRATNVVAILPESSRRAALHAVSPRESGRIKARQVIETQPAHLASMEPKQQLLKAVIPEPGRKTASSAQPQEWVVFTSWQVESSAPTAGTTADYDTGAQTAAATHEASGQPSPTSSRITVTQLILRVDPVKQASANQATDSAPAKKASSTASNSVAKPALHRSAALPFDSGWLVMQL